MERLSNETLDNAIKVYRTCIENAVEYDDDCEYNPILDKATVNFLEELKEYRDLEEQGLILKLPCKVGDEFWIVAYCDETMIRVRCTGYIIQNDEVNKINDSYVWLDSIDKPYDFWKLPFNEFDNQCFLTKEEAEKALERMGE